MLYFFRFVKMQAKSAEVQQPPPIQSDRLETDLKGRVTLKKTSSQLMTDIGQACQSKDLSISCRSSGEKFSLVPASSLLLSVSSPFLKSVFDEVKQVCDEMPLIVLPDFDVRDVQGLLEYAENGCCQCQDVEGYENLQSLVRLIRLGEELTRVSPDKASLSWISTLSQHFPKEDLDQGDEFYPSALLEPQMPYEYCEDEKPSVTRIKVEPALPEYEDFNI